MSFIKNPLAVVGEPSGDPPMVNPNLAESSLGKPTFAMYGSPPYPPAVFSGPLICGCKWMTRVYGPHRFVVLLQFWPKGLFLFFDIVCNSF